jgi:hypothetical protein
LEIFAFFIKGAVLNNAPAGESPLNICPEPKLFWTFTDVYSVKRKTKRRRRRSRDKSKKEVKHSASLV